MELIEYLHIIRKRIWIIVLITIASALGSWIICFYILSPVYEGKTALIVGRAPSIESDKVEYNDILMYQTMVKTYGELVKSRLVVEEVISRVNYSITYEMFLEDLKVTPKADTQILEVSIMDKYPDRAATLANTLVDVFVEKEMEMMNTRDVKIMDRAVVPQKPIRPRTVLNTVIAAFVGLMTSLGLVFLIEYLDNTIKTEEDVQKYLGITILASIPFVKNGSS